MNTYLKSVVSDETGVPGASFAVQTYGDFLNFNPHLHAITTDGSFNTVRHYGWYSNKSRGMRKKAGTDDTIPAVMPNDMSSKDSRQNWARLIQKIYEVDPLVCPKCQGPMKIIAFIEELDIIEKILRHLDLWDVRNHGPPQKVSDYILELVCNEAGSQIPELESWY